MRLLVYGDFNCPFSALASARAADLEPRGLAAIDWRGVEHDPAIPLAGEIIVESRRNDGLGAHARLAQLMSGLIEAGDG